MQTRIVEHQGRAAAALLLAGCAAQPAAQLPPPRPPNVLFIAVDDLRPELGCYGATYAQTPHLNAFAQTAARFENHFVHAPSCGPSRYALLTGRSAASTGTIANDGLYRGHARIDRIAAADGARSLPEHFRRAGYHTVQIGKVSHTPDGRVFGYDGSGDGRPELPDAWDTFATPVGEWGRGWGAFFAYVGGAHREARPGEGVPARAARTEFVAECDDALPDGQMAEAAVAQLAALADGEEPFFLGLGFFKPHLPFVATAQDWAAFDDAAVPLPDSRERWPRAYTHDSGEFRRYDTTHGHALPTTEEEVLETRRAYLACVRYVDRQIGKVLDALEDEGLADSTIVVVWGDHGWHLGESGVWGKHTVLERSLRSPLLVRVPGVTRPGSRMRGLAGSVDLYPTLVELCSVAGVTPARELDGVSLVPMLEGSADAVRESCAAWYGKAATVRTDTHRLVARREGERWTDVRVFDTRLSADALPGTEVQDAALAERLLALLSPARPRR